MPTIHILPEHEARKIAAGEVVERPSSVVKELIENALDAGATDIQLIVHDGGKERIQIVDNGIGMSPEDAHLSIAQHATSKIESVDQLTTISTFGFRGEALSSISAVSNFQLLTRRAEDAYGYQLQVSAGSTISSQPAAANQGTTITIDNLFHNVPARKKFLKQRETEWRSIHQLVYAYALVFPHVQFTLIHDTHTAITTTSCSSMKERVAHIADTQLLRHLIPVQVTHEKHGITLEGVISNHQYSRYDRRNIFLFVNKRWVKNHALSKAILNGYQKVLQPQQYPFAAISLTIPPTEVDINIHPRKEEVLLLHPYRVNHLLENAVLEALNTHISNLVQQPSAYHTPAPIAEMAPSHTTSTSYVPTTPVSFSIPAKSWMAPFNNTEPVSALYHAIQQPTSIVTSAVYTQEIGTYKTVQEDAQTSFVATPEYELKGQYALTYLLMETPQGLLVLDQHAAHECVRYQNLVSNAIETTTTTLLFPELISLSSDEYAHLVPHLEMVHSLGIIAEPWSNNQIRITGTAPYLHNQSTTYLIRSLVTALEEESALSVNTVLHTLRARIACITAMKAGDKLNETEMHSLITQYFATTNRLTCPHGRPTSWIITQHDLEKVFKRIT